MCPISHNYILATVEDEADIIDKAGNKRKNSLVGYSGFPILNIIFYLFSI